MHQWPFRNGLVNRLDGTAKLFVEQEDETKKKRKEERLVRFDSFVTALSYSGG